MFHSSTTAKSELPLLNNGRSTAGSYQSATDAELGNAADLESTSSSSSSMVTRRSLADTARESIRDERSRVRMFGWLLIWVVVGIFVSEVSQRSAMLMSNISSPSVAMQTSMSADHDVQRHAVRQEIDLLAASAEACPSSKATAATTNAKSTGASWFMGGPDPELVLTSLPKIQSLDELPKHWDWRDFNATGVSLTTSVLNQMAPKACGSCWAFGTVSALSDRIRIAKFRKYKKLETEMILSPQPLLDCGMRSFGSCNGGDPRYAHKWIHENGIVDWTCNPYIASHPSWFSSAATCGATQCRQCLLDGECKVVESPKKWYVAEYGTLNATNSDEFQLEAMNEIYHRGPIVVSMYSLTHEYRNFKGGYILRDSNKYPGTTHVVSLIGWGSTDDGLKYWIVRNSDGTQYGEDGFFRVERGVNTYNIESHGAWAVPIVGSSSSVATIRSLVYLYGLVQLNAIASIAVDVLLHRNGVFATAAVVRQRLQEADDLVAVIAQEELVVGRERRVLAADRVLHASTDGGDAGVAVFILIRSSKAKEMIGRSVRLARSVAPAAASGRAFSILSGVSEDLLVSTSIGHQIGGDSHDALIDSLVKTNVVAKGSRLESALRSVDRALFTPEQFHKSKDIVYANRPLKIGVVATISTPQQHAQVLGFLEPHLQPGMKAIDIGSGSGILVAIMAHLVGYHGHVTGVDIVPELVQFAQQNLNKCLEETLLKRTQIVTSSGKDTMGSFANSGEEELYDCIHVGVAVETKAEAESYLRFLKPGGGLLIPLGFAGAEQKLVKMTKHVDGSVEKVDVMSVLCQPMLDEVPVEVVRETRSEKLARVEKALTQWRDAFEKQRGRKPSRDDMLSDPESRQLFQDFAALRK